MNILLVSDVYLPTVSGVASSTDSIARFMVSRGHTVYLVCPKPVSEFSPKTPPGLTIAYTPSRPDPLFVNKAMTLFPFGFPALWKILRAHHIDIIHIQEPGSLGICALLLSKLFGVPTLGADHFSLAQVEKVAPPYIRWASVPLMKFYIRLVYRQFSAIMVPTATAAGELSSFLGHTDRIHPVSNGVDTEEYVPRTGPIGPLRVKYALPEIPPVFVYIGRLDADKNIETILQALSRIRMPLTFVLAGVGKQQEHLHALADSLSLGARLVWMKELNKDIIIELYQLSDVFVITSPVETQSIVALQALSCGLPVIAANAGALPELVVDGKNGYLIGTHDVGKLTEKMEYLATHPVARRKMGKESRAISLLHHKPKVLSELESLYRTIIG